MNLNYINVLLVEDDEDDIFITRHLLDEAGTQDFRVKTAETLQEALAVIDAGYPHIILLDLSLPDSQGIETLSVILSHAEKIPVILLTGLADKELGLKAVQSGAQDFLFKGRLDRERLSRSIHYAIERKSSELALKREQDKLEEKVKERTAALLKSNRDLKQAEKHTADAKHYLESVISTSQDGIMVIDSAGRFEFGNDAFVKILGWPREELIGNEFLKVIPEDMLEFVAERWEEAQRGEAHPHELDIITKSGERRTLAVTQQRMKLAGEYKHCSVLRDITVSRNRENKLREANERLLEHDRARSDFVFNVSHELKTPLASMGYAIDNILKGIVGDLPKSVINYIEMMKEDVQRLSQTVGDILDLSRIEANTFKLDKVKIPLSRLMKRTVNSLQLQAEENNLTMTLDTAMAMGFVECDPRKMERVILNILRNAVKFTPPNGSIEVVLCSNPQDDNMFCISITDSGIGIPEEHIHNVTERYFRVGEHVDGTGLGLAISKDIIELHGGSIAISSPPPNQENGTQVHLYIPKSRPPKILAVDDDNMTRELLGEQLKQNGYTAQCCANGAEALEYLKENIPDAIITDLVMPVLDGVAMIAEVKTNPEWRYIPIIAITGGELSQVKREILEGFDIPALAKPYKCSDLLDLMETTVFGMHYLNRG